jgi:hypothetical protein
MRNLNQKQQKWVLSNTPIGKVLDTKFITREVSAKIIGHEHGYVVIEYTHTYHCNDTNYNMGLITKEEFLSGNPKVSIRVGKLSYNHPEWTTYFPELLGIKSK